MEDQELLEKFKNPETRHYAFNMLVRKYQEKIYWHIRKMVIDHEDADDLVQEVFLKVWKNLAFYRGDSALYTWIYRIATNDCLHFLNKKRRKFLIPIHDVNAELSKKLVASTYIEGDEIQLKLQRALLTLPDKQRLVFNMKYFDELSYEAIAEITGTSIGALKASYHHAVKKIQIILKAD